MKYRRGKIIGEIYNVIVENGIPAKSFDIVIKILSNIDIKTAIILASINEKVPIIKQKNNRKMIIEAIGTIIRLEMTARVGRR